MLNDCQLFQGGMAQNEPVKYCDTHTHSSNNMNKELYAKSPKLVTTIKNITMLYLKSIMSKTFRKTFRETSELKNHKFFCVILPLVLMK